MIRHITLIISALFIISADLVQYSYFQREDTNAKIKATFFYSFAQYFEWPEKEGSFIINIMGENPGLISELNKTLSNKSIGSQKIEIRSSKDLKEVEKANILFLTPDKSSFLADAVTKFKGKGTLIITEKQGLAKVGSTINFVIEENKQKFELNKSAAGKAGLKVASALEKYAATVIN